MSDPNNKPSQPATDPWAPAAPAQPAAGSAWGDVQRGAEQAMGGSGTWNAPAAPQNVPAPPAAPAQPAAGAWAGQPAAPAAAGAPSPAATPWGAQPSATAPTPPAAPPPPATWGATPEPPAAAAQPGGSWGVQPTAPPPAQSWGQTAPAWQPSAAPAWTPGAAVNYAGAGQRVAAFIIDGIILTIASIVLLLIGSAGGDGLAALMFLVVFVISILYKSYFEATSGATPGKRVMGIKVVREDGGVPGWGAAIVRNVLYIVDGIGLYLVGFILMLATEKKQRLGDMAARTIVVKA